MPGGMYEPSYQGSHALRRTGRAMTVSKADFSQIHILVIDDSDFVRRLLKEVLLSFGVANVFLAESAQQAFARMEIQCPDLIICDWQMHPVDGLSILRKIRLDVSSRISRVPFIMLTGHNGAEDVSTAIGEGADSYIVKPFSAGTLMSHLLKVIAAEDQHDAHQQAWAV
jgi:two-component system chemotaxis response regulator CheY